MPFRPEAALELADMLGIPAHTYRDEPLDLIPALQNYVSRLPLNEFEQSDWVTLHSDLTSYLADVLIRRHDAKWEVVDDPGAPDSFRFVIEARGLDGETHRVSTHRERLAPGRATSGECSAYGSFGRKVDTRHPASRCKQLGLSTRAPRSRLWVAIIVKGNPEAGTYAGCSMRRFDLG